VKTERNSDDGNPLFNSALSRAIKNTIRISLLVSGCFFVAQPGFSDTSNLPTVHVPPPPPDRDPPGFPFPFPDDDYHGDGGGNGSGYAPPEVVCGNLRVNKPAMCPNPIPIPSGANYAFDKLPHGSFLKNTKSTMRMAIAYSEGRAHGPNGPAQANPTAAWLMNFILEKQTANFANSGMPLVEANREFRTGLQSVCTLESLGGNQSVRRPGPLTVPEQFCFDIMKSFDQETNDRMNFITYFYSWTQSHGLPLPEYIPGVVISDLDMENSIAVKWREVSKDSQCAKWWISYEYNKCDLL